MASSSSPVVVGKLEVRTGQSIAAFAAVSEPNTLEDGAEITVRIVDDAGVLREKSLHAFDWDFYTVVKARRDGPVRIEVSRRIDLQIELRPADARSSVGASSWSDAQPIELGRDILGTADERPYIAAGAQDSYQGLLTGQHWYKFEPRRRQLVFFNVFADDRDVPADLEVFTESGGELESYREGSHQYRPEATQNFPGLSNYRTRIVEPGQTYYLRVSANHPAYVLRTAAYSAGSSRAPAEAVRLGMDALVSLGDAWLNNIPRRGSVATRDTMAHAETQNRIACHPTQFTTRAYLTALKNGYVPVQSAAADNLFWQLRNNPRPFPGHDGVNWARMIFSARTVSSRVPVLLAGRFGESSPVTREVARGAAGFLDLHYRGLKSLADDEADGASPSVSPAEIALQSWQTYRLAGRLDRAADIENQLIAFVPKNVIDLNWQLAGLATINPRAHATQIGKLKERLWRAQHADGRFGYALDASGESADFISYHALYALAVSGSPLSDPRIARLAELTWRAQQPSGFWQGEPVVKAFNTPFRETQFAVMALATLYPARFAMDSRGPAEIRYPAASKIAMRQRAIDLRRTQTPDTAAVRALLGSANPRDRWTGLRVLAQQFREWTRDAELLAAVRSAAADPLAANRLMAASTLARWYAWSPDPSILETLTARAGAESNPRVLRMVQEAIYNTLDENIGYAEAWMRTMSDPADRDRTVKALHARSREQAAILARHLGDGVSREKKLRILNALWDLPIRHAAIPEANRQRTEVVLPAYYEEFSSGVAALHEPGFEYAPYREAAQFGYDARQGFHKTRVGNDSELIDLSGAGPELEAALIACLDPKDPDLTIHALKAGAALGSAMSAKFTARVLDLAVSGDAELRATIRYVFERHARGRLLLGDPDRPDQALVSALLRALEPRNHDALAVALPLLAEVEPGSPLTREADLQGRLDRLLREAPVEFRDRALAASAVFPRLADSPLMRQMMLEALASNDRQLESRVVDLVIQHYFSDPRLPALAEQFARAAQGRVRTQLLDALDHARFSLKVTALSLYNPTGLFVPKDSNLFSSDKVQEFVAVSLADKHDDVRAAALDLVRQHRKLRDSPNVKAALNRPHAEPWPRSQALRAGTSPENAWPDFDFFVNRVQPILARAGADGKACVMCHATHGVFPLRVPSRDRFTEAQSRDNYRFALRVINLREPSRSLILVKPTRPNDSSGDPNLYLATHNGGERWAGNEASEEYRTILDWIRGARR